MHENVPVFVVQRKEFKSFSGFDCKSQHDLFENMKPWLEGGWISNSGKPMKDGGVSENDSHWEFCNKI